jgi:hypothetical protein
MTTIAEKRSAPLLKQLDTFVDRSIDSMSSKELREFQTKRKKIMADARRRATDSGVLREIDEQDARVLQA